jgi:hypothetical protein
LAIDARDDFPRNAASTASICGDSSNGTARALINAARAEPMNVHERETVTIQVVRWGARAWAAALFLFWGAFFAEHMAEWFGRGMAAPPVGVMALHSLHGLFLVGLLIGWRWELAGGLLSLVAGVAFFLQAAGPNGVLYSLIGIVPAIIWIGLTAYEHRRGATPEVACGAAR